MTLISPLSQFLYPLAIPVSPLRPPKPGHSNSVSPLLRLCTPSINYSWHAGTPELSPMCSNSTFFRQERSRIYPLSVVASYSFDFFFFAVLLLSTATRVIPITPPFSANGFQCPIIPRCRITVPTPSVVFYQLCQPFLYRRLHSIFFVVYPFLHPRVLGYPILIR